MFIVLITENLKDYQPWIAKYKEDGSFWYGGPLEDHMRLSYLCKQEDKRFMNHLLWGKPNV